MHERAGLGVDHVNQTATYLGARLGMLGFVVTRNAPKEAVRRKTFSAYNDSPTLPRKMILIMSDDDLRTMIEQRIEATGPTRHAQEAIQPFVPSVQ